MSGGNDPSKKDPNKKKKDDDDDKKGNEYFVGNGQAVLAPNNNNNNNNRPAPQAPPTDLVAALLGKARDPNKTRDPSQKSSGTGDDNDSDDGDADTPPAAGSGAFSGQGRRLGLNSDGPSPVVEDGRPVKVEIRVTFYRNGFTIDDGPLLSATEGEGKATLEAFDKGIVPPAIAGKHPRRARFDVKLIKKDQEDYVKQFQAFEGSGRSLGGNSAGTTTTAAAVATRGNAAPAVAITANDDTPRGRVLLQLPDGTRRRVETNPSRHTVAELFGEAAVATGVSTSAIQLSIRIGAGGTTALLPTDTRTLAEAKVDGSAVFVKTN